MPHLLRLAFPPSLPDDERLVMVLDSYFDESATDEGSETLAVAGYLSTPELWTKFNTEWRLALEEFGIEEFFHMKEFAHRVGQFSGWDEQKRRDWLNRAISIINNNVIGSIGIVIPMADYQSVFTQSSDDFIGHAYGMAASASVMEMAQMLRLTGIHGQVAHVFESGALGRHQFERSIKRILNDPATQDWFRLAGAIQFACKKKYRPLQAADLLAWELQKHLRELRTEGSQHRRRYPLKRLAEAPHLWGYVEGPELAKWARVIDAVAKLGEDELAPPTKAPIREPIGTLSLEQARERWRWCSNFMGQSTPPRQP